VPAAVWLGFLGAPHAAAATGRIVRFPDTPRELIPAQAWSLLSFVLMAVGIGAGLILDANL
jgi:hypothetical protein